MTPDCKRIRRRQKTRNAIVVALAMVVGIGLVCSPILLSQTQVLPLTTDMYTPSFEGGASSNKTTLNTDESRSSNAMPSAMEAVSLSAGLGIAIAIGLVAGLSCYFVIKMAVNKKMPNAGNR